MLDCFKYKKLENILFNTRNVIIDAPIKCADTKEVYRVVDISDQQTYILKVIYSATDIVEAEHTISFFINDTNNYFIEMIDYYKDDNKVFLLLKYYADGSLYNQNNLSDEEKDSYIEQILNIGCYLHENSYIHCDIKPDNFFVDGGTIRVGDLETVVKVNTIKNATIEKQTGTKGFKYDGSTYSLKDEIFAFIATIYYIEMGELLISNDELEEIASSTNKVETINEITREYVKYISRKEVASFLQNALQKIDTIDCCYLKQEFTKIKKSIKAPEVPNSKSKKPSSIKVAQGENVKKPTDKKLFYLSVVVAFVIVIFLFVLLVDSLLRSTIRCDKAYFITQDIVAVEKGINKYYYNYANGTYTKINDERVIDLATKKPLEHNRALCVNGGISIRY